MFGDIKPKEGMRVRLIQMGPDPNPVPNKTEGTIRRIDGIGQIHVDWDNGRTLALDPNIDEFELLPNDEDQIDIMSHLGESDGPLTKRYTTDLKKALNSTKPKVKIKTEVKRVKKSKKDLEEMDAGGSGGLAGAAGYSYSAPLSHKTTKKESKEPKTSNLLNELTTTGSISSTVDFIVNNLLGWGTKQDMSPPWPSPKKNAENGQLEDWWWQKIPTYNGGVITDPYAHTDDVWNDETLDANVHNDLNQFRSEVLKNPKKYKQFVTSTDKAFDLNIDPPNEDWKFSLQKGITLKDEGSRNEIQTFRNKHYNRTLKKEEVDKIISKLITETKEEKVHTKKWDRCVKDVEMKNKKNGTDYKPEAVCTDSIGYKGSIKKSHRRKEDLEEETTFGSVFGGSFPVGPSFAAKKGQHIPSKNPLWKGGKIIQKIDSHGIFNESEKKKDIFTEINKVKFSKGAKYVKIKDRCAKYNNQPWCSQGAIDKPLELSDNTFENIKNISEKTGLTEKYILDTIVNIMNEDTHHKLSLMDKFKIKIAGIDDEQVIYNLNNKLPIDWGEQKKVITKK